jgi:hypothetical protein
MMEELQRIDRMCNFCMRSENVSRLQETYFMSIFQIINLHNARTCNMKLSQTLKMEMPSITTEILNILQ